MSFINMEYDIPIYIIYRYRDINVIVYRYMIHLYDGKFGIYDTPW